MVERILVRAKMKKLLFHVIICLGTVLSIDYYSTNEAKAEQYDQSSQADQAKNEKSMELFNYANMYAADGQYDQSLQVIQTIDDPFLKTEALINLAYIYKEKDKDKFLEMLYQSFQVAQTIENTVFKVSKLTDIAGKYVEAGQNDKALEILSQSLRIAQTIEKTAVKTSALTNIAGKYIEAGQNDKAAEILSQSFQVVKAMESTVDNTFTLWNIANMYAVVGQYDQSLQVAKTMEDVGLKIDVLTGIAGKYIEVGQKDKASETLFQSLQSTRAIKDTTVKRMKLDNITNMYAKDGIEVDERTKNLIYEIKKEFKDIK